MVFIIFFPTRIIYARPDIRVWEYARRLTYRVESICTEMAKDTCYFKLQYIAKLAVYFSWRCGVLRILSNF